MTIKTTNHAGGLLISLEQARDCLRGLKPVGSEFVPVARLLHRITAEDCVAVSDCPSVDSSLKDGFAVCSGDIETATPQTPVLLKEVGVVTAGGRANVKMGRGQTVRIMTGAQVPAGADAVLASEFARRQGDEVYALRDAHPGRNILKQGSDVDAGKRIIPRGTRIFPCSIGLLTAAGISEVPVFRQPRVMIIATGSELAIPGEAIRPGQVAASNLVTLSAELQAVGISGDYLLIQDDLERLRRKIAPLIGHYDVILTCGGVLDGDKDFTMRAMQELGVTPVFHRVRVGPGKGVCLGRKDTTWIFNLPGGPPSNHVAFHLLAKPGILRLAGVADPLSGYVPARLIGKLTGQQGWTQIFYGRLAHDGLRRTVEPLFHAARLQNMAAADCLIELPEDHACAEAGTIIRKIWKIR